MEKGNASMMLTAEARAEWLPTIEEASSKT